MFTRMPLFATTCIFYTSIQPRTERENVVKPCFLHSVSDTAQCGVGGAGGNGFGGNAGITGGGTLPRRTTVGYIGKHQSLLGSSGAGLGGGAHLISPGGNSGGPGGGTIIGGTLTHHLHGGGRSNIGGNDGGGGGTAAGNVSGSKTVKLDDLIHLPGPLTEDAVMRTLQTRFNEGKFFVSTYLPSRRADCYLFLLHWIITGAI